MPTSEPQFKINERVYDKDAPDLTRTGTVTKVYEFGDALRYVVTFEDGSERVFFDNELEHSD
jgi:hypothetical protein